MMTTLAPLLAGAVAAQIMLVAFAVGQQAAWTRLDWRYLLGSLVLGSAPPRRLRVVGHLLHIALGVASAAVYARISDNGTEPLIWLAAGLMQAAIVTLCIGLIGVLHPAMIRPTRPASGRRVLEAPGDFGRNWGVRTPMVLYLAHAIFTIAALGITRILPT